jgi:cell wall-associated NlpC family hydrolase
VRQDHADHADHADQAARTRFARFRALPGLRAAAGALALATAVTGISTAAAGSSTATKPGLITNVTTVPPDQPATAVLAAARAHLGDKYVYGGTGPTTWDCSGFTSLLWRTSGGVTAIPRTARLQQAWATPVPASQVLPGDLYFLGTPATHVGIVVGGGMVIDASSARGTVVLRALWTATGVTFGRVPRPTAVPVTPAPATAVPATGTAPVAPATTTTPPVTTPVTPAAPAPTIPATTIPATAAPAPTIAAGSAAAPSLAPPASRLVAAAERLVGAPYGIGGTGPSYDDGALVAAAWKHAGGGLLPLDRNALAARTRPVAAGKLIAGDLVIYGTSNVWHVGIYVGKGMMVDASRIKGRVMLRPLLTSPDRRFGRVH